VLAGRLLVATPRLADPNFARAVVLLLDHGAEGAFGVVLDRPLPVPVGGVLPGWQALVTEPGALFQGGPVGLDGAIGLATVAGAGPHRGIDRLVGPFGLVDLDGDPAELTGEVTGLRVFAGHAGWGGGQLEAEIADHDWYVLPAEPGDAVSDDPAGLWRRVLRRQGGDLAIVSLWPLDARLN
jgi:putative transcriptional regulator